MLGHFSKSFNNYAGTEQKAGTRNAMQSPTLLARTQIADRSTVTASQGLHAQEATVSSQELNPGILTWDNGIETGIIMGILSVTLNSGC